MPQLCILSLITLVLYVTAAMPPAVETAVAASILRPGGRFQVLLTTAELVVGQNRVAFGLLRERKLLTQADVVVRVYALHGQDAALLAEAEAPYYALEVVEQGRQVHIHPDGSRHGHDESRCRGIYVTQVTFPQPGDLGA